jgi:serine phosphatase RsbU (regulator of sigma subunit)
MDISLIAINTKTKQMDYSGASRPLLIVKPDGNFEIIKGNKFSIGGHLQHNKTFTDTSVQLEEGDLIYAYSDGYADQFGGDKSPAGNTTGKGKKFKNKALRELLISSRNHTLSEQETIISNRFESWKGDYEQVDDVCMLGIKI